MSNKFEHFNFWKENKNDGHFQLTQEELCQKFLEWMQHKSIDKLAYHSLLDSVSWFIADKAHGLNSVGNTDNDGGAEYSAIVDILKPVRSNFIWPEK